MHLAEYISKHTLVRVFVPDSRAIIRLIPVVTCRRQLWKSVDAAC